ncbi:MAG: Rid family hydrolase [Verrucomicrobiales bacterium]
MIERTINHPKTCNAGDGASRDKLRSAPGRSPEPISSPAPFPGERAYFEKRTVTGEEATEYYFTAAPGRGSGIESQVSDFFRRIRRDLEPSGAWIMSERIYCTRTMIHDINRLRTVAYRGWEEEMQPVYLVTPDDRGVAFTGMQVHAVAAAERPVVLRCQNSACCARLLHGRDRSWLTISGLSDVHGRIPKIADARSIFERAESILKWAGGSLRDIARTWFWFGDIDRTYVQFNRIRNEFFTRRGLIDPATNQSRLPASTGIGIRAAGSVETALDLVAVIGGENPIRFVETGGDQNSPRHYGVSFSRATVAQMPAGRTIFVSGTAALDGDGRTEATNHVYAAITHVRSILRELNCGDEDVLSATIYCANSETENEFRECWGDLAWPRVVVPARICRTGLTFEIEVTARPSSGQMAARAVALQH